MKRNWITSLLIFCVIATQSLAAELRVPAIFSDHMVLQAGKPINVWGWGTPGQKVNAWLDSQSATETTVNEGGKWLLQLPAVKPSDKGAKLSIMSGDRAITINDVLFGEVWICSGQSNMGYAMEMADGGKEAVEKATYPWLRFFNMVEEPAATPQEDCAITWRRLRPEIAKRLPAIPFFFARELNAQKHVPVGIIHASVGGSPIEAWTRESALRPLPQLASYFKEWDEQLKDYDPKTYPERSKREQEEYKKAIEAYRAEHGATSSALSSGDPKRPPIIMEKVIPVGFFNGMINPVVPFTLRGILWYQGESNVDDPWYYQFTFPAMINDWRTAFNDSNLPFLYVQLAGRELTPSDLSSSPTAELREFQAKALSLPYTGMAVAIDTTGTDWHPSNKLPVAMRLWNLAKAIAYDEKNIPTRGPTLGEWRVEGDAIVVKIKEADKGLEARGGKPIGFTICGEDRVFVPAEAKIEGSTIAVHSDQVKTPVAARYAWSRGPDSNIFGIGTDLPMEPFRTDNWAGVTWPAEAK